MAGMLVFLYFVDLHAAINVVRARGDERHDAAHLAAAARARPWCRATRLFAHEWTGAVASPTRPRSRRARRGLWWWLGMCEPCAWLAGVGDEAEALSPLRYEPYAWILQDAFAVCLVVLFLQVVRLGSIKVAAVLLCCAFAYDVFFVFLSPLVFGSSVMIKVAIGDGPAADADYCEKYADDPKCRPTSLPFLLQIPRVDDYMGGAAMLGLGDLVLPGLIVAFAARYDVSTGRGAARCCAGRARSCAAACCAPVLPAQGDRLRGRADDGERRGVRDGQGQPALLCLGRARSAPSASGETRGRAPR